jgi:hypothetical protein
VATLHILESWAVNTLRTAVGAGWAGLKEQELHEWATGCSLPQGGPPTNPVPQIAEVPQEWPTVLSLPEQVLTTLPSWLRTVVPRGPQSPKCPYLSAEGHGGGLVAEGGYCIATPCYPV